VTAKPKTSRVASVCKGASTSSQRYLGQARRGLAVRCGPQLQKHYTARSNVAAVAPRTAAQPARRVVTNSRPQVAYAGTSTSTINGATRIVPKHVLANRQNTQNLQIPEGYRPVWSDDRLNPMRAEQSLAGQAQIKLVWTQTVPRRLIDVTSGRDVTASTPLVYPYIDKANQTRNLGSVSIVQRDGQILKRVVRNARAAQVRQPVVSSRSAPVVKPIVKRAAPKATASRFVNVGTFDQQGSAHAVAKRIQRMGLPVRIGKYTRSGKTYRMVLAGPFGADATRVLTKLKSAGYQNAVLR
jgi:cell division protein FtsN